MRDGHYEGQAVRGGGTGSSSLWSRQLRKNAFSSKMCKCANCVSNFVYRKYEGSVKVIM